MDSTEKNVRFNGKVALITGAASGMGLLTCQRLAEEGATVLMLDVDERSLRAVSYTHLDVYKRQLLESGTIHTALLDGY